MPSTARKPDAIAFQDFADAVDPEGDFVSAPKILTEARRRILWRFVRDAWPTVEPDRDFVDNWHIHTICDWLERVTAGDCRRLLINVPPGTAKSLIVSVFWPAWVWATAPGKRFLALSYGQELATRDAVKMRTLIESRWYQDQWPTPLKADQNAKTQFETKASGWRIATSIGGRGTGLHPDFSIVDDPHTVEQAESITGKDRDEAIRFVGRTLSTRGVARKSSIVVVMQRLEQRDLSGWILDHDTADQWVHLCIPMRAEDPKTFPPTAAHRPAIDPRPEGALLWPALFPEAEVRLLERTLADAAPGQLQQRPVKLGGGLFRRDWFPILEAAPLDVTAWVRFWDIAATDGGGDWTVGALVGLRPSGRFVLADIVRGQWSSGVVDKTLLQTARLDGRYVVIREEQEPGSSGKAVINSRRLLLSGYDYAGIPSTGKKEIRWKPLATQAEAGNVDILAGPWVSAFLAEAELGALGSHDDQLDAASGAFNEVALKSGPLVAGIPARR